MSKRTIDDRIAALQAKKREDELRVAILTDLRVAMEHVRARDYQEAFQAVVAARKGLDEIEPAAEPKPAQEGKAK